MRQRRILFLIVLAQFCCTSLWFAGNGVMDDLLQYFTLGKAALGNLTSAVQFGFISGTLTFALLSIADRFSPSKVFFVSTLLASLFNLGIIWSGNTLFSLLVLRFLTGYFLAGIYPIGMKIAADYFQKGLGKSLGYLVGALVIGTAFPHFLKATTTAFPWRIVLITTSTLAVVGGALIFFLVPDGPHRKPGQKIELNAFLKVFNNKKFKIAAFGYFGHMWELYTFWAFVPIMLQNFVLSETMTSFNLSIWAFVIIGLGGVACVIGGYLAQKLGAEKIAFSALSLSGLCCLLSPFIFQMDSLVLLLIFLILWGLFVIADSPLFSTLVAQNAIPELKGTALTIVNCIGFSITIISIQLINYLGTFIAPEYLYLFLSIGPFLGLGYYFLNKGQADSEADIQM